MSSAPNPETEPMVPEDIYYFLLEHRDGYYPAFVSYLTPDFIPFLRDTFRKQELKWINICIGEVRFLTRTDRPLHVLGGGDPEAIKFASDNASLDLFPSGACPETCSDVRIIPYPAFWHRGVAPLVKMVIGTEVMVRQDDLWVPFSLPESSSNGGRS